VGGSGEGGSADGVVLGSGPEAEDDEIGLLGLPPERVADVRGRGPDYRVVAGGGWRVACGFSRRVDDQPGLVAEVMEGFCQKAEVAMPEKLVGVNGQVGVEEDFQNIPFANKR